MLDGRGGLSGYPSVAALNGSLAVVCWTFGTSRASCSLLAVSGAETVVASTALVGSTLMSVGAASTAFGSRAFEMSVGALDESTALVCYIDGSSGYERLSCTLLSVDGRRRADRRQQRAARRLVCVDSERGGSRRRIARGGVQPRCVAHLSAFPVKCRIVYLSSGSLYVGPLLTLNGYGYANYPSVSAFDSTYAIVCYEDDSLG